MGKAYFASASGSKKCFAVWLLFKNGCFYGDFVLQEDDRGEQIIENERAETGSRPTSIGGKTSYRNKLFWTVDGGEGVSSCRDVAANREEERARLHLLVNGLIERSLNLDLAIDAVARALRVSQPPMHGKYDIRWWVINGKKSPVLVRWEYNSNRRRYEPSKVDRLREIRSDRGYALNHAETVELLGMAQTLLNARKRSVEWQRRLKQSLTKQETNEALWVEEQMLKAERINISVMEKLNLLDSAQDPTGNLPPETTEA